jgi:AcrR family transcriptional regulator
MKTTRTKKEAKTQAIIREAERLFGRYGYRKVSVDEIVEAAGVAKGTFYLYFRSKDALYKHIFDSYHKREVYPAMDMVTREADLKRAIYVDMVGALYYLQKRPILMEIMLANPAYLSESVSAEMVQDFYRELAREVFQNIEDRLGPGLTLDDVFHLNALFLSTLRHGDPSDPAFWRLAANSARVLIDGMFSRSRWNPRPVEEIIKEIDLMLSEGGET